LCIARRPTVLKNMNCNRGFGDADQVITYNVSKERVLRADLPFFGGKKILKPTARKATPTQP